MNGAYSPRGGPYIIRGTPFFFFLLLVLLFSKHILAFLPFYAAYVDDDVQSQAIKRSLLTGAMEDAGFGYASLLPIKVKEQNLIAYPEGELKRDDCFC